MSFDEVETEKGRIGIPCAFEAYLELVDWTGRVLRADKRGAIESSAPPILKRLAINEQRWMSNATAFEAVHDRRFNRSHRKRSLHSV